VGVQLVPFELRADRSVWQTIVSAPLGPHRPSDMTMVGTSLPRAAISNFSCHLPSGKIFKNATIAELFWVAGSVWAQEPTNELGLAAWPGREICCPSGDDWASEEQPKAHAPAMSRFFSAKEAPRGAPLPLPVITVPMTAVRTQIAAASVLRTIA